MIFKILLSICAILIGVVPTAIIATPVIFSKSDLVKLGFVLVSPFEFFLIYPTVAGILSLIGQGGIISCKVPRETSNKTYFQRRIYGFCWTAIYYFVPVYWLILTFPKTKAFVFRLFGYKGSTNFVNYPDTWIRDLPLLSIGERAYLSNRATIGTNICLSNGYILVDRITVADGGLIGHLSMLAPGANIESNAEVGVGTAVGIRARVGQNSKIGGCCAINHGAVIGKNCNIGTMAYIGVKTTIKDRINVPPAANIPGGITINSREDLDNYIKNESKSLNQLRDKIADIYNNRLNGNIISMAGKKSDEYQDNSA